MYDVCGGVRKISAGNTYTPGIDFAVARFLQGTAEQAVREYFAR
jgi:hypothetical protein